MGEAPPPGPCNHPRRWSHARGLTLRVARKGTDSRQRLGRHRWTIERAMAWLAGCRRPHRRHERKAGRFLAFARVACAHLLPPTRRLSCPVSGRYGREHRTGQTVTTARAGGRPKPLRRTGGHSALPARCVPTDREGWDQDSRSARPARRDAFRTSPFRVRPAERRRDRPLPAMAQSSPPLISTPIRNSKWGLWSSSERSGRDASLTCLVCK
ncbi:MULTISPECIES: transposase [Streptomyces]|uniref:transposase n=1 Tax=Streptomyces TaxID=1883 RepID=UPI0034616325